RRPDRQSDLGQQRPAPLGPVRALRFEGDVRRESRPGERATAGDDRRRPDPHRRPIRRRTQARRWSENRRRHEMRRRDFMLGLGASLVALRAKADSVDDTLAKVARARAGARTLVGPFTQTATVGLLRSQVVSNGKLYLQYPSRLRWELGPPDSVTYWVAPEGLAYRSAHGSGRVPIDTTQQADVEALRAMLGGDVTVLRSRFDVREVPSDTGGPAFECTPKSSLRLR